MFILSRYQNFGNVFLLSSLFDYAIFTLESSLRGGLMVRSLASARDRLRNLIEMYLYRFRRSLIDKDAFRQQIK